MAADVMEPLPFDRDDDPTTEIVLRTEWDGDQWAAIATNAEAELGRAMDAFERRVRRLLARPPKDLAFWLQKAIGQWENRTGAAQVALATANRYKPADGWRPIELPASAG
ncbi:hypothetical protein [Microlunatus parietis]|uniref:Uncharacterized protein n=1 Tax=Microlunatus parietis TaxID=682979 RepID=A0A7Y9L9S3_9ACTN|nr:hypothetical protein [Microlunatus parietis]NYE68880.1 hypothetical protein [Microlunatus parietis]